MQILLVEDDEALAKGLVRALQHETVTVNHVAKGQLATNAVKTTPPDMLILDLGLPDIDGLDVLKKIRRLTADLPILILTARVALGDKVKGLDLGADDYLIKPFEVAELLARIRAFERRASAFKHGDIVIGEVTIDPASYQLIVAGQEVKLARKEFMVLKALMENAGRVQTRESLESKLYSWGEEVASNAIEVHIHHLRKKLPDKFIKTLRGIGYIVSQT